MRENSAKNLDKLLLKDKLNSFKIWAITGICVVLFGLFLLGFTSDGSEKVVGEVTGTHTRMHEEGHTLYLMVKIPESNNPVKVRLPKGQLIKKGAKIEINQINTLWYGKSRFSFSKYLE
jgi:hypothetical protein